MRSINTHNSHWKANTLAGAIAVLTVGTLYINFDPEPNNISDSGRFVDISRYTEITLAKPAAAAELVQTAGLDDGSASTIPGETVERGPWEGVAALEKTLGMLRQGHALLKSTPDYTATFYQQERCGAHLKEGNLIDLKIRHRPFGVYMRWLSGEKGREVLYVDGDNDNEMLAHPGGWKGRLLPSVKVDPHGAVAMSHSRHPITDAGLLEVARRAIGYRERDLQAPEGVTCILERGYEVGERPCYRFDVRYDDISFSEEYSRSILLIDEEYQFPVAATNYAWPEQMSEYDPKRHDETTLIELYTYSDIQLNSNLAAIDFDSKNSKYSFQRK